MIVALQRNFRYKKELHSCIIRRLDSINHFMKSIADSLNNKLCQNIIDNNEYNTHLSTLDNIFSSYLEVSSLNNSIFDSNSVMYRNCLHKINKIIQNLQQLVTLSGTYHLTHLLEIFDVNMFKELEYYSNTFIPISMALYTSAYLNNKNKKIKIKEQSLIDIFSNIINKLDNIDNEEEDTNIINNLEKIMVCKLKGVSNSVQLALFGAKLYIRDTTKIFVISGYFKKDPLNIYRTHPLFVKKNDLLNKSIINLPQSFKNSFIQQITIRDFIVSDTNELIISCQDAFNELNQLKQKTISSLVKYFLAGDFEKQRRILTLFLLAEDDTDTQYLAYIMYDMISNENFMLKPQPLAEQVFNSLHWSVQKKFKIAMNKVDKYTQNISEFNETEIPYDKRICLLKAPDSVKSKAMDKLKEINNRSNDSSVKAQQYLDGLLKIPFGIYIKEEIINYLSDFRNQFKACISVDDSNPQIDILKKKDLITSGDIDHVLSNVQVKIDENKINDKLTKYTVVKLKELIKNINNKLTNNSQHILYGKKNKTELISDIMIAVNNNPNMISLIEFDEKSPELSIALKNSLMPLKEKWCEYQLDKVNYIKNVRQILDTAVYGHNEPKVQLERIIAQWINGDCTGYCFGFEGPPGTGKTTIAKKGLTKCLSSKDGTPRPFSFIPIGGSTNGSSLEGHCYTYVGSTWGRIVDVLMESKCMNPIIFIDELDKVSNTEHGKEIIGILTHMTDSSQNDEFIDKYFAGVKIDLSKALIIFSYNDPELIDRILLDRIHRIKFKALTKQEKFHVTFNHLLPEIFTSVGINKDDIIFDEKIIEFIIDNYTFEAGARKLKEKLFEIIRELNLRVMYNDDINFPISVTKELITKDIFSDRPQVIPNTIPKYPRVGLVNGLYATGAGLGGITVIETFEIPSDNKFTLELTGQQGDVMKESMKVARTVAWNVLPTDLKKKLYTKCETDGNFGIHIHCPEGSTPKDGPSAGGAITLAIISLLTNIPINNTIGITGEIDLNGSIRAIGGLESKVDGAKKAGVKTVLCPSQNKHDVEKITNDKFTPIDDNFKIVMVDNIWDILKIALGENKIKFNNYVLNRI
jgi:ATP-dependent Lon protease